MDPRAQDLVFETDRFTVYLSDGRALTVPLAWFPVLLDATPEQRQRFRISASGKGLHWPELDEDISVEGLLLGRDDPTSRRPR